MSSEADMDFKKEHLKLSAEEMSQIAEALRKEFEA
jgi:hypothetical protein